MIQKISHGGGGGGFHPLQEVSKYILFYPSMPGNKSFHPLQEVSKSAHHLIKFPAFFLFPSLIGSIEIYWRFHISARKWCVSIPYRKYRNLYHRRACGRRCDVSIPYRKYRNQGSYYRKMEEIISFHPLQEVSKYGSNLSGFTTERGFHPLQEVSKCSFLR